MARAGALTSGEEVAKHNTRVSCWIIVHGAVGSYNHRARVSHTFLEQGTCTTSRNSWMVRTIGDVHDRYQVPSLQITLEGRALFSSMEAMTQQKVERMLHSNCLY
jgi:hypothetical protein